MKVSWKYFNFKSVSFKTKQKYANHRNKLETVQFSNFFTDFKIALEVFEEVKKSIKKLRLTTIASIYSRASETNTTSKGWDVIDSNYNAEKILLVLQAYGWNRDFIIYHIFGGYTSKDIGTENESQETLMPPGNWVLKMPISPNQKNEERLFILMKDDIAYPLFIDAHHHLMGLWVVREFNCDISSVINHIIDKENN